jgi:hypothetical protein
MADCSQKLSAKFHSEYVLNFLPKSSWQDGLRNFLALTISSWQNGPETFCTKVHGRMVELSTKEFMAEWSLKLSAP